MAKVVGKRSYRCVDMSLENTLHFISEVKRHRCLWDRTHEEYKHKIARENAWTALSLTLGYSADDLVSKWQSLRSSLRQYRYTIRRRAKEGRGDADKLQVIKWPYYSAMSFTIDSGNDEEFRVISLPAKLVPAKLNMLDSAKRSPISPEPNTCSSMSEEPPILDHDSSEECKAPSRHIPLKILSYTQTPSPNSVQKRKLQELSSGSSSARPSIPTTSRRIPKEPEFVAIKVEATEPASPVEQTFNSEPYSCNMSHTQNEDDVYGHSIALQMKQFSPKTKRKLQIQIHELISKTQKQAFEKEFGFSYDSS